MISSSIESAGTGPLSASQATQQRARAFLDKQN